VKAGTAAALIADHEGKAVAARVPYFHVFDGINDAGELHSHSTAVAILDADRPPIVVRPQLEVGCWGRWGLLCRTQHAQWHYGSTCPCNLGATFRVNPLGLDIGAPVAVLIYLFSAVGSGYFLIAPSRRPAHL
jgi:hypothetical protein